jgi:LPS export ABC transporter protein LptC
VRLDHRGARCRVRLPRPVGIAVVIAVIAGAYFIGRSGRNSNDPNANAPPLRDPGYAARNAEVIETGEDGRERYRLTAENIHQHSDTGVIELRGLAMNYRPTLDAKAGAAPEPPNSALRDWHVTADRGAVQANGDQVTLDGNVQVKGPAPGSGVPIELTTDVLFMSMNAEVIRTESPVVVNFSGHRVTAVGLYADLKARKLRLESDVHGKISR